MCVEEPPKHSWFNDLLGFQNPHSVILTLLEAQCRGGTAGGWPVGGGTTGGWPPAPKKGDDPRPP